MIKYRSFKEKELDQIFSLYVEGYSDLYGKSVQEHATQFVALFQTALKEDVEGDMFVAEENNVLIGFAVIHKEPTNEWKFGPIVVHPSFQRRGIGSYLLQMCIKFAQSKQIQQFYLKVHEHNQAAINLYKKFGFSTTNVFPSDLEGKNYLKMLYSL
ncbi:MAG: GNAT family N-acetyltransferase [Candidatus Helarchaeota archaeon]|nr:GNAT family N-acetyltransferase [Candidatus Helarchaeota archaeon]